MKTFDEYIQGRILKIRNNIPHAFTNYSFFGQLATNIGCDGNGIMTASEIAEEIINWGGIGKQRAKDYAHYIVAYLEETEWMSLETHPEKHIPIWIACNVFMDDFPRVVIGYWNGAGYKSIDDGLSINYPRAWTTYTAEKPRYPQVDNSQENECQDTLLREQIDRHSHLTEKDANELRRLIGLYTGALIAYKDRDLEADRQKYFDYTDEIIQFINSLKGE